MPRKHKVGTFERWKLNGNSGLTDKKKIKLNKKSNSSEEPPVRRCAGTWYSTSRKVVIPDDVLRSRLLPYDSFDVNIWEFFVSIADTLENGLDPVEECITLPDYSGNSRLVSKVKYDTLIGPIAVIARKTGFIENPKLEPVEIYLLEGKGKDAYYFYTYTLL